MAADQLFRFVLIENEFNKTYTLVAVFHHIVIDGTQINKINKQIESNYHQLESLEISDENEINKLKEYLRWERRRIENTNIEEELSSFKNYPLTIDLPYDHFVKDKYRLKTISYKYQLNKQLYIRLKNLV